MELTFANLGWIVAGCAAFLFVVLPVVGNLLENVLPKSRD